MDSNESQLIQQVEKSHLNIQRTIRKRLNGDSRLASPLLKIYFSELGGLYSYAKEKNYIDLRHEISEILNKNLCLHRLSFDDWLSIPKRPYVAGSLKRY